MKSTDYLPNRSLRACQSLSIGSDGTSADHDLECEQEGEHEGENEGCTFVFSFSGATLSITQSQVN